MNERHTHKAEWQEAGVRVLRFGWLLCFPAQRIIELFQGIKIGVVTALPSINVGQLKLDVFLVYISRSHSHISHFVLIFFSPLFSFSLCEME